MESTAARKSGPSVWAGRIEDDALLRGAGRFGDDGKPAGALAAYFVRSPHAFANIEHIDVAAARNAPGVVAVLTAADLAAAHYHSISHPHPIPGRGGKVAVAPHRPALASSRVLHVGEPVAMVVAVSAQAAQDAGEKIAVDYQPLTPVTDARAAIAPGAPQLWPEAPGNIAFDWTAPADPDGKKQAALERAFQDAAHVVRVELVNQRLVVASLEPRSATASYDPASKQFTLRCPTQGVASMRGQLADSMNIKPEELRVLTDDVGGAFGMKGAAHPEYVALLHAARALGKPVHWLSTRSEAFLSDCQGRDSFWTAELALNRRGRFLGLRVNGLGNMGAYITPVAHFIVTMHISGCLPTVYDIPHAQVNSRCVFTNTLPTAPYRGAGRPEASYLLERVIDAAADVTGIDAAELRRRNLIAPGKMPYTTVFGNTYDSGDFPGAFERALTLADYAGFAARKKAAKKAGKLRGIGIGCYLEIAGAFPEEAARISFPGGNRLEVSIGAGASGQGHKTVFGGVAARRLGVAPEAVTVHGGRFGARRAGLRRRRLALGHVCRRCHRAHRRPGAGKGQARRRPAFAGGRGRSGLSRRQIRRKGLGARSAVVRGGRARGGAQAHGRHPGEPRHPGHRQDAAVVPERLSCRRGRDRSGDRRAGGRLLCGGRRLRQRAG